MENRALVVLFNGNEVPNNIIERISKEISTWCETDIEKISIFALSADDITKVIVKNYYVPKEDAAEKCKTCDNAIKVLAGVIDLNTTITAFAVNLSTMLIRILDRERTLGLTERDKIFIKALNILRVGGPRSERVSKEYSYTKEIDKALREICNRIFDENGKIKK